MWKRRHKYKAQRTYAHGKWFPSKLEAARYTELFFLERSGDITELELQPQFKFIIGGNNTELGMKPDICTYPKCGRPTNFKRCALHPITVTTYRADFRYKNRNGIVVVEDVKGYETPEFKIKKRLFEAYFGKLLITKRTNRAI